MPLTSTDITVDSIAVEDEPIHPKSLVRSYTKWQLESLKPEDYAVGIVCALPLELLAVRALFDQTHPNLHLSTADSNHYALGSMGRHKISRGCCIQFAKKFPIGEVLPIGIGGGVPSSRNDIRLGDVVVSKPIGISPGVIQYDMGKALENGEFEQNGFLQPPPRLLMTALGSLKSDPHFPQAPLQEYIQEIAACRKEYRHPGPENDRLFSSYYAHNTKHATCGPCSANYLTRWPSRSDHHPRIHYGLIASGNRVMKDAKLRDRWSMERNVLCFEMEAAGIMNTLPCLVIRGLCDYSDSHKNKRFQEYAAATAASYAKLMLSYMKDSSDLDGTAFRSATEDQSLLGVFRRALSFIRRGV
jgi:nucleoside phosphorylase